MMSTEHKALRYVIFSSPHLTSFRKKLIMELFKTDLSHLTIALLIKSNLSRHSEVRESLMSVLRKDTRLVTLKRAADRLKVLWEETTSGVVSSYWRFE